MQIKSFKSFDDMVTFMEANERIAIGNTRPWQWAIGYGDHWMRSITAFGQESMPVFGYVLTLNEIEQAEMETGSDEDELAYTITQTENSFRRGYRFSRFYSMTESEGELGNVHVSNLYPITAEQFELAKSKEWKPGNWFTPVLSDILDAILQDGMM